MSNIDTAEIVFSPPEFIYKKKTKEKDFPNLDELTFVPSELAFVGYWAGWMLLRNTARERIYTDKLNWMRKGSKKLRTPFSQRLQLFHPTHSAITNITRHVCLSWSVWMINNAGGEILVLWEFQQCITRKYGKWKKRRCNFSSATLSFFFCYLSLLLLLLFFVISEKLLREKLANRPDCAHINFVFPLTQFWWNNVIIYQSEPAYRIIDWNFFKLFLQGLRKYSRIYFFAITYWIFFFTYYLIEKMEK